MEQSSAPEQKSTTDRCQHCGGIHICKCPLLEERRQITEQQDYWNKGWLKAMVEL